jgi:shikimate kinase
VFNCIISPPPSPSPIKGEGIIGAASKLFHPRCLLIVSCYLIDIISNIMKNIGMKNIVLTGFMGTGKSEVSKKLSKILGWKVIDIDTEIEKSQNMKITEIFKQFGEPGFRDIETETIKKLSKNKNVIISTGGGAVLRQENIDALRENGVIICLTATPETILKRISNNNDRPLLQVEEPLKKIRELLEFRMPHYEKADIIIDTENKTPLEIAEEIIEKIRNPKH